MSTPAEPAASATPAHREAIERLRALLEQPPAAGTDAWAGRWRAEHDLIAALPPRFGQVLEALLARLESAAMFGEESCSFSAADLRGELQVWLAKAERALE
jgi:hypothetical protein